MATSKHILATFLVTLLMGHTYGAILDQGICTLIQFAFQALGCASGTANGLQCQIPAFILRLQLGDEPLCDKEPCIGYGSPSGRSCTTVFPKNCDSADVYENGICPLSRECCLAETFSSTGISDSASGAKFTFFVKQEDRS